MRRIISLQNGGSGLELMTGGFSVWIAIRHAKLEEEVKGANNIA